MTRVNISSLKLALPDCCQTNVCLEAWEMGSPACYPYSIIEIEGKSLLARYICPRCARSWNCHWSCRSAHNYFMTDGDIRNYIENPPDGDEKIGSCESYIEKYFWAAIQPFLQNLIPQYRVDKFRVDWAIPELKFAVELDGKNFHTTKDQVKHDWERDNDLLHLGWTIMRFSGIELKRNFAECILETLRSVAARYKIEKPSTYDSLG